MKEQREAVVLAGGLGTRLKSVVSAVPKALAPISGKPFLHYLFKQLQSQSITRVILATGYESQQLRDYCAHSSCPFEVLFSEEHTPLGTGGALRKALALSETANVFVLNGDTFFPVDFSLLLQFQISSRLKISLALKSLPSGERYGSVVCENGIIRKFVEKNLSPQIHSTPNSVLVNGGVFILDRQFFIEHTAQHFSNLPFSLEKDYFAPSSRLGQIGGIEFLDPFIDIGTPDDYLLAQTLIPQQVDRSFPSA